MKYLDRVKVLTSDYEKKGVKEGAEGTIIFSWLRKDMFEVVFSLPNGQDYADEWLHVKDLELVKSSDITDEDILEDLPKNDPRWWCKVEEGYILNLKGERKNKIPYDYNS